MVTEQFREWMRTATVRQKRAAAARAGTSLSMLYQLASEARHASSELASRIETAVKGAVTRADVSETCAECKYYKKCKK
jgi:DNA-binding transcriptional regulator YdaS (Cro superfamily)